jgi:hypothetical protein
VIDLAEDGGNMPRIAPVIVGLYAKPDVPFGGMAGDGREQPRHGIYRGFPGQAFRDLAAGHAQHRHPQVSGKVDALV